MESRLYLSEALVSENVSLKEEIIGESANGPIKEITLEGSFQTANSKNRNKRVYSEVILKRETNSLNDRMKETGSIISEMNHPTKKPGETDQEYVARASRASMENCCALIKPYLEFDGRDIRGKLKILYDDASVGQKLYSMTKAGFIPGISSRAVGGRPAIHDDTIIVPEDVRFVTFDIVTDPSNFNSRLNVLLEEEIHNLSKKETYEKKLWSISDVISRNFG